MRAVLTSAAAIGVLVIGSATLHADTVAEKLASADVGRGIVAVVGLSAEEAPAVIDVAAKARWKLYAQPGSESGAAALRKAAARASLLGTRVFVEEGALDRIHLSDNVADFLVLSNDAGTPQREILRALRPQGVARWGEQQVTKPELEGADDWSHPYHGPDNNPQSEDKRVRGSFRTQFLGYPKFSPMPEQSVIAGGRIYKAMGHIAHKANQNEMLNTLLCINAYNGTVLWKRPLPKGFMIHRNTMIATKDALYLGDHESCKVIDGRTGKIRAQIKVPTEITDGPVWKWMAMKDGVLYGLVGNLEIRVDTQRSARRGLGHWPWGMWKGHDYKDPRTAFGFGRTLVAIDLKTHKLRWHHRDKEFLDARAVCMNKDRIFVFSAMRFLACFDAKTGKLVFKNADKDLLDAIGPNGRAQHYITGYATTCYMKCTDDYLFFAGPQRKQLVAASARDGKLAWTYPMGNLQLILRKDAVWAAGPQRSKSGVRLDYKTGQVLATFPARRACTRATGCADSIFFRASGGTVRVMTETVAAQHIDPMRPPCQDGVLIAGGHLYWGPWMCGCQLSLYGNICLRPSPEQDRGRDVYRDALTVSAKPQIAKLEPRPGDWTAYRGGSSRSDATTVKIADQVQPAWKTRVVRGALPTAPVVAGDRVFIADRSGAIQCYSTDGKPVWTTHVAGAVYYSPTIAHDRLYVGSADGRVYCLAAASGQRLWSFRVAPEDRWIPVYDRLISAWPVAGGLAVHNDRVYAAAGIAHYDGTYVVALDALSGKLLARNTDSGVLASEVNNGISLQGNLTIVDNELRFLAGGVYETARYDLKTLKCLNNPKVQVKSQFRTAFYPYYPAYGKYVSLDHTCEDGCNLTQDASYEGSRFTSLALHEPLPPGVKKPRQEASRWIRRRGGKPPKTVWREKEGRRFTSFIVSKERFVGAGHTEKELDAHFLVATDLRSGKDIWKHALPAAAVKGGASIDGRGRIYVALENGELHCFAPRK